MSNSANSQAIGIPDATAAPKWIHETEAVRLFKVSKRWLYQKRVDGKLPFSTFGGKIVYRYHDLMALIEEGSTAPPLAIV